MSKSKPVSIPTDYISQAFMAALLAAQKGDDALAGEILRDIADNITVGFRRPGASKSGSQG